MRVLLLGEDKQLINIFLSEVSKDFVADAAYSSDEGDYLTDVNTYDSVVIESKLIDSSYLSLINRVKEQDSRLPVIWLTDFLDGDSIISALDKGVDCCLPKTISIPLLGSLLKTIIRKHKLPLCKRIGDGVLCVDIRTKVISIDNVPINLRRKEYDILEYLILNKGRTVSKEELLEHVWCDSTYMLSNCVEVHIKHIRNKIEKPFNKIFIKTVRGFGYKIG